MKKMKITCFCVALILSMSGCKNEKLGFDESVETGFVTIIGEFQGTRETASILKETVASSKLNGPVAIGLEVPSCAISKVIPNGSLLKISGDDERPCDYAGMTEGRISNEIIRIVESILADKTVKVFGIENGRGRSVDVWDANLWESLVADRIETVASEGYQVVIITGNLHARKGNYTLGGKTTTAFAARLSAKSRSILVVPRTNGEAYFCTSIGKCKNGPLPASSVALAEDGINCDVDIKNFDCLYTVPTYTASKPIPPNAWKLEK